MSTPTDEPDSVAVSEDRGDWQILTLLIDDDQQRPSAVGEVAREYGDRLAAIDAVARLQGAGLIHRTSDDFVFVTRAAARDHEIAQ